MRFSRWVSGIPLLMACALIVSWATPSTAEATTSSCVICHLDEDMIVGSLAEVKGKKSAMQSGSG